MSYILCWSGVSAVDAEWIPQLLPQYCHFGSPLESPSPWFCASTGTIRCHRSSTFCMVSLDEHYVLKTHSSYVCVIAVLSPLQSALVGSSQQWKWNTQMAWSVTNYFPGFCLKDRYSSKTYKSLSIKILLDSKDLTYLFHSIYNSGRHSSVVRSFVQ